MPSRALAEVLAEEWQSQGGEIDPSTMPITRIVNSAIDGVAPRQAEGSTTSSAMPVPISSITGPPSRSVSRMPRRRSEPGSRLGEGVHSARFVLGEGVMHVAQPEEAIAAIRRAIQRIESPFALAALHVMTTLSGSVLIALAHAAQRLDADAAWAVAHVD